METTQCEMPDYMPPPKDIEKILQDSKRIAIVGLSPKTSRDSNKVAQYLYNCPEYLESTFAAFKAGFATVNTNYRYAADELVYLWDNGDVTAVVFHGAFVDQIEAIRDRVPRITNWLWVDDASGPCPDWATPYEASASAGTGAGERSPSLRWCF